jgi:hypothetical protein
VGKFALCRKSLHGSSTRGLGQLSRDGAKSRRRVWAGLSKRFTQDQFIKKSTENGFSDLRFFALSAIIPTSGADG